MRGKLLALALVITMGLSVSTTAQTGTYNDPKVANLGMNSGEISQSGHYVYYSFDAEFAQYYDIHLTTSADMNLSLIVWQEDGEFGRTGTFPQTLSNNDIRLTFVGVKGDEFIEIGSESGSGTFQFEITENDELYVPRIISYEPSMRRGDYAEWDVELTENHTQDESPLLLPFQDGDRVRVELLKDAPSLNISDFNPLFPSDGYTFNEYFDFKINNETRVNAISIEPFLFPTYSEDFDGNSYNLRDYLEFGGGMPPGNVQVTETGSELQITLQTVEFDDLNFDVSFTVSKLTGHLVTMEWDVSYSFEDSGGQQSGQINMKVDLVTNNLTPPDNSNSQEGGFINLPAPTVPILLVIFGLPIVRRKMELMTSRL